MMYRQPNNPLRQRHSSAIGSSSLNPTSQRAAVADVNLIVRRDRIELTCASLLETKAAHNQPPSQPHPPQVVNKEPHVGR